MATRTAFNRAATIAPASRLIADVQLDNGSPLELGVVATGRVLTSVATPKVAKLRGGSQDGHGEKVRESQMSVDYDYKNLLGEYDAKAKFGVVGGRRGLSAFYDGGS